MSRNETMIYMMLGADGYVQYLQNKIAYQQYIEARREHEQQERMAKLKCTGKILLKTIEPTVDFIQKWDNINSNHPFVERGLITGEYALKVGAIAHNELELLNLRA